jgi:uncharacterized protein YkwD
MRGHIGATLVAAPLIWLGIFASQAAVARTASAPCQGASLSPNAANSASVDAATLCLIDEVRIAHRLHPLRSNSELRTLASSQVRNMVSLNYFADDRPPGLTPMSLIAATRYPARATSVSIGQNIGWGTGPYATPASMVAAWMASPEHRRIILTRQYRDAGVGMTPAVPPLVGQNLVGATYAIEFAVRAF